MGSIFYWARDAIFFATDHFWFSIIIGWYFEMPRKDFCASPNLQRHQVYVFNYYLQMQQQSSLLHIYYFYNVGYKLILDYLLQSDLWKTMFSNLDDYTFMLVMSMCMHICVIQPSQISLWLMENRLFYCWTQNIWSWRRKIIVHISFTLFCFCYNMYTYTLF